MPYPTQIDPDKIYELKLCKRVTVANAVMGPRDRHFVKGVILQALVDEDAEAIVLAVEV